MQNGRIGTCIDAEFDIDGRRSNGRIRNVSESGVFVGTEAIPEEGENVELTFRARDGGELRVTGLVWWTTANSGRRHRQPGFGLRLIEDNDDFRRFWASLADARRRRRPVTSGGRATRVAPGASARVRRGR